MCKLLFSDFLVEFVMESFSELALNGGRLELHIDINLPKITDRIIDDRREHLASFLYPRHMCKNHFSSERQQRRYLCTFYESTTVDNSQ